MITFNSWTDTRQISANLALILVISFPNPPWLHQWYYVKGKFQGRRLGAKVGQSS